MSDRILIVDDDPHICDVIRFALEKAGMTTAVARNGAEALERFQGCRPDLVVLDVGLPELDGLEVCRRIRKSSDTPILFLSARNEEIDRVLGLEIGGDDYVTKPFSPRELVARVSVILKRARGAPHAENGDGARLSHGLLTLDPPRHEAFFNGAKLSLTGLEFAIIKALITRPGLVLSREQLMRAAYANNVHVSDRTIDSHVRNIRAKLAAARCASVIETVQGIGFRLGSCEAAQ